MSSCASLASLALFAPHRQNLDIGRELLPSLNEGLLPDISNAHLGMIAIALFTKLTELPNNASLPERHPVRLMQ